jgi:hypothetical protein
VGIRKEMGRLAERADGEDPFGRPFQWPILICLSAYLPILRITWSVRMPRTTPCLRDSVVESGSQKRYESN